MLNGLKEDGEQAIRSEHCRFIIVFLSLVLIQYLSEAFRLLLLLLLLYMRLFILRFSHFILANACVFLVPWTMVSSFFFFFFSSS